MVLLQIVLVSPGTHLVKSHEFQLEKKKSRKLKMLGRLCNQTVSLKSDSKTLYYSTLKLKYSPSFFKAQQRLKEICIVKQQP